jgi:hypothetical protein
VRRASSASVSDVPAITVPALLFGRRASVRMFLRAVGYKPVNDTLLSHPHLSRVLNSEGCQCFLDTRGRWCMVYSCGTSEELAAAWAVALYAGGCVRVETYRGPPQSGSDWDRPDSECVAVGNVRICHPRVAIFRAEGSDVVPGERLGELLGADAATGPGTGP